MFLDISQPTFYRPQPNNVKQYTNIYSTIGGDFEILSDVVLKAIKVPFNKSILSTDTLNKFRIQLWNLASEVHRLYNSTQYTVMQFLHSTWLCTTQYTAEQVFCIKY